MTYIEKNSVIFEFDVNNKSKLPMNNRNLPITKRIKSCQSYQQNQFKREAIINKLGKC